MLETGFYQRNFGRKGKSKPLWLPERSHSSAGPHSGRDQGCRMVPIEERSKKGFTAGLHSIDVNRYLELFSFLLFLKS